MATRIRALGTFRNNAKLPNGIVRRGQKVTVSDRYAEELVDGGKAEIVEEELDTSGSETSGSGASGSDGAETDSPEDADAASEEASGEGPPERPEAPEGAPEQPDRWKNTDLPEECPKYETLKGEDIHTLGDLQYFVQNDLLGDIKGIGPAYVDRIKQFLQDEIPGSA